MVKSPTIFAAVTATKLSLGLYKWGADEKSRFIIPPSVTVPVTFKRLELLLPLISTVLITTVPALSRVKLPWIAMVPGIKKLLLRPTEIVPVLVSVRFPVDPRRNVPWSPSILPVLLKFEFVENVPEKSLKVPAFVTKPFVTKLPFASFTTTPEFTANPEVVILPP